MCVCMYAYVCICVGGGGGGGGGGAEEYNVSVFFLTFHIYNLFLLIL